MPFGIVAYALLLFYLDNLCRNSCIQLSPKLIACSMDCSEKPLCMIKEKYIVMYRYCIVLPCGYKLHDCYDTFLITLLGNMQTN